jgi:hypothetical protein
MAEAAQVEMGRGSAVAETAAERGGSVEITDQTHLPG